MEIQRLREIHSDSSMSSSMKLNGPLPVSQAVILTVRSLINILSLLISVAGAYQLIPYTLFGPLASLRSGYTDRQLCFQPFSPRQQRYSTGTNSGIRLGDLKKLVNIANLLGIPVKGLMHKRISRFPFPLNLFCIYRYEAMILETYL